MIVGTLAWVRESREDDGTDRVDAAADGGTSSARAPRRGPDLLGAVLSAGALGLLVFSIVEATTLGWWSEKAPLELGGRELHGPSGLSLSPLLLAARTDDLTGQAAVFGRQLTDSAGSILPALRGQGMDPAVLEQLELVFTDGARIAMAGAVAFLLLGFAGAVAVARAALRAA